ncbi:MAG: GNAT family N-acetyltransferase [Lachnospiraceae bacterium]
MDIKIRQAVPDDLDAVTRVEELCFPKAEAATLDSFYQRLQIFPDSFFVAEDKGQVIGFINGCVTNERTISDEMFEAAGCHKPDGDYQSIFGLDVAPEYQHRGLATILMKHMIVAARSRGRKGLILTCKEPLIGFYESFGYRNLGVSASVHGGALWYDMILEF